MNLLEGKISSIKPSHIIEMPFFSLVDLFSTLLFDYLLFPLGGISVTKKKKKTSYLSQIQFNPIHFTINMNNNSSISNNGINDSFAELLSLPVNFTVDPLLATNPNGLSQKRQASFSSASSVTSDNDQSSSESIVSIKKSRLSLDDKDQKTKER